MSIYKIQGGTIRSIVNLIPENIKDNLEEELIPVADRESLVAHTGIRYRRTFPMDSVTTTELFIQGISNTLHTLQWDASTITAIVCVTQTPETHIPAVSCLLHNAFNFNVSTTCLDINLGCSGYVYGLHQTLGLLQNQLEGKGRALLCCGDITSKLIQNDKTSIPIFSDGVSITAVEFDSNKEDNCSPFFFNLETLGSGHTAIRSEFVDNKEVMRLNGIEVFNYSVQYVPKHIKELLASVNAEDISLVILHQANKLINDAIAKRLPIPNAEFPSTLFQYGNTASASIPITLVDFLSKNKPKTKHLLLSGFGVGFSMGSVVFTLDSTVHFSIIEFPTDS
jgi:3-oxoacyl-[acyl-carrier-protein] synthase-3